jgi:drug/metabolite transporter (DMT)-like permease
MDIQAGSRARAVLGLATATMIWGAMFPISGHILQSMDALSMTLLRYGLAAPVFLLLLARSEGWQSLRPGVPLLPLVGLGALGFAGFNLLMFFGVSQSRPEHGAIVMALQPLIAAMILWARTGKRPAARSFAALALAIVGVVLLVTDGDLSRLAGQAAVVPTLMMIAGGTCWVLYSMGAARYPGWSPLRYTALSASGGAIVILVLWMLAAFAGLVRVPVAAASWFVLTPSLVYLTLLAAVVAVLCWNSGIRALGPQNGMLFINLAPLTALVVGVASGQAFGRFELIGAVLVLASLVANQLGGGVRRVAPLPACTQGAR